MLNPDRRIKLNMFFTQLEKFFTDIPNNEDLSERVLSIKTIRFFRNMLIGIPLLRHQFSTSNFDLDTFSKKHTDVNELIESLAQLKKIPTYSDRDIPKNEFEELARFNHYLCQNNAVVAEYEKSNVRDRTIESKVASAKEFIIGYLKWDKDNESEIQVIEPDGRFLNEQKKIKMDMFEHLKLVLSKHHFLYVNSLVVRCEYICEGNTSRELREDKIRKIFNSLKELNNIAGVFGTYVLSDDSKIFYHLTCFVHSSSRLREFDFRDQVGNHLVHKCDNRISITIEPLVNPEIYESELLLTDHDLNLGKTNSLSTNAILENAGNFADLIAEFELYLKPKNIESIPCHCGKYHLEKTLRKVIQGVSGSFYLQLGRATSFQSPYSIYKSSPRVNLIWDTSHLSPNAQDYLTKIKVIWQEQLLSYDMNDFYELVVKIEHFMLTLMESGEGGFYQGYKDVRRANRSEYKVELYATRQFYQLIYLMFNLKRVQKLSEKMKRRLNTPLLRYFLEVFDVESKRQLRTVSSYDLIFNDIKDESNRQFFDELIKVYRFNEPFFYKLNLSPKEDGHHKSIHIQRHKTRLNKVQKMLQQGMEGDVVIIRCSFHINENMSYAQTSEILTNMFQKNKRKAPFSSLIAYLGYWEEVEKSNSDEVLQYSANIVFLFKTQVLIDFPLLEKEILDQWMKSCEYVLDDDNKNKGLVEFKQLGYAFEELQCKRLTVETTHKVLRKKIIDHLSVIMVYRDVFDDSVFKNVRKWLIKKNTKPVKKKRKSKTQ